MPADIMLTHNTGSQQVGKKQDVFIITGKYKRTRKQVS